MMLAMSFTVPDQLIYAALGFLVALGLAALFEIGFGFFYRGN